MIEEFVPQKEKVSAWFQNLRDDIVSAFDGLEYQFVSETGN